jgi:endonuclease/exonuclease/phosphatase family metal-dependent hydrolase
MGWDAACIRICTCGCFEDVKTKRRFWVFNTHFDHVGVQARKNSAILILNKIDALNLSGYPVILTGDFNDVPESEPVGIIMKKMKDSKAADKQMSMGPDGTFNGFDLQKPLTERIDFIFTGNGATATDYGVIREKQDGKYASDHCPVVAVINF